MAHLIWVCVRSRFIPIRDAGNFPQCWISVQISERSSWDFGLYGIYGIYMHYTLQYRNYRTGRNLTRTFPKIVPKFVLQNLPSLIYIYKTVMFDRVFALGRVRIPAPSSDMPLARRVPEIRHDRSLRSSNRRSRDRLNHGAPESKPNPASQNSTTLLWKWSFSYQKVFLSTLSWFCGLVRPRFKI